MTPKNKDSILELRRLWTATFATPWRASLWELEGAPSIFPDANFMRNLTVPTVGASSHSLTREEAFNTPKSHEKEAFFPWRALVRPLHEVLMWFKLLGAASR